MGIKTHSILVWSHLNFVTSAKTHFQIQLHSQVVGGHKLRGRDTIQPTTKDFSDLRDVVR